jgi:hypothetical protein
MIQALKTAKAERKKIKKEMTAKEMTAKERIELMVFCKQAVITVRFADAAIQNEQLKLLSA